MLDIVELREALLVEPFRKFLKNGIEIEAFGLEIFSKRAANSGGASPLNLQKLIAHPVGCLRHGLG